MKDIFKRYFLLISISLFAIILTLPAKWAMGYWQHFDPNNINVLPSSHITSLVMDTNRLWIGTDQGLVEYNFLVNDPIAGWTIHTKVDPNDYAPITAMDIDQNGLLWLGTPQGLVSYEPDSLDSNNLLVHEGLEFIKSDQILAIAANSDFIWVATDRGLNRLDKSGNWILDSNNPDGFYSITAKAVDSRENDTVWVLPGLFGVYSYTLSNNQWDYFSTMSGPFEVVFNSIRVGESNDIWLGTDIFGLWRFEPDPNIWTHWEEADYELPSDYIQAIGIYRGSNRIILATGNGIARYDLDLGLWQPISIPNSMELGSQVITDILVDPNRHQVWFGTESNGLYLWKEGSITWSNPANGSENVSLDTNSIEVVFNDRIDPNSVELGTLFPSSLIFSMLDQNLNPITNPNIYDPNNFDPNTFSLNWHDPNTYTHLIIEPKFDLYPNTWYKFKFTTDITDYSGKPIVNIDNELMFKTPLPPTVVDTDPDTNANNVNPYAPIKIWFNKGMDSNSFFPNVISFLADGDIFPTFISEEEIDFSDPNFLMIAISVDPPLQEGTKYTFIVSKNVTDLSGNPMSENFEIQFTTGTAPQPVYEFGSPYPANFDVNVSLDTNISVKFNKAMDTNSVEASFNIEPSISGSFSWIDLDSRVVFKPDNDLAYGTTYQVTIDADASDIDGIPLGWSFTWSFTTLSDPNELFPRIESVFPAEDDSSVSIYTNIKVRFTHIMDTGSVEGAFSLLDDQNATVEGIFNWLPDSTEFLFAPNDSLDPNHTYKVSITTSAQSESGFALRHIKIWEFTVKFPQTIEPAYGSWPEFPVDLNIFDIPSLVDLTVMTMAIDPINGGIWAGLAYVAPDKNRVGLGLFHYDGDDWKQYTHSDPNCGLTSDSINDLAFDSQGNLWIATEPDPNGFGGGVNMYDGQNWHWYDPETFYGNLLQQDIQDFSYVNAVDIYHTGAEDLVWIATTGGIGAGKYNTGANDWEWSATTEFQFLSLITIDQSSGTVWLARDLFWTQNEPCNAIAGLDANKLSLWPDVWDPNIWIWTPNGGFPKIRLLGEISPNLRAIIVDDFNQLWLGTKDGLYRISINDLRLGVCNYELYGHFETGEGLPGNSIYDVALNPHDPNTLWVATDQGISLYQLRESIESPSSWIRYPLTGFQIFSMLPINNAGVQVGTDRGLLIVGDYTNPIVIDSYPSDFNIDIPGNDQYWITFSELMEPTNTEAAFTFMDTSSSTVSGVLSCEGKTIKFSPDDPLIPGEKYFMVVDTFATDLAGNPLAQIYQVTFNIFKEPIDKEKKKRPSYTVYTPILPLKSQYQQLWSQSFLPVYNELQRQEWYRYQFTRYQQNLRQILFTRDQLWTTYSQPFFYNQYQYFKGYQQPKYWNIQQQSWNQQVPNWQQSNSQYNSFTTNQIPQSLYKQPQASNQQQQSWNQQVPNWQQSNSQYNSFTTNQNPQSLYKQPQALNQQQQSWNQQVPNWQQSNSQYNSFTTNQNPQSLYKQPQAWNQKVSNWSIQKRRP